MLNIEKQPLIMNNLLTLEKVIEPENWLDGINEFENYLFDNGIYQVAPVIISLEEIENDPDFRQATYYLPINSEAVPDKDAEISYIPKLELKNALVLRQADRTNNLNQAYEDLKKYAKDNNLALTDSNYSVITKIYDDYVIDLFMEIKGEK